VQTGWVTKKPRIAGFFFVLKLSVQRNSAAINFKMRSASWADASG
jgi:hypothetical protein